MFINREYRVYRYCVESRLYTCGSCQHYEEMLKNVREGKADAELTAYDIYFHSDIENRARLEDIKRDIKSIYKYFD